MSRRWRGPYTRRGEFFQVLPPPTAAAPSVWVPGLIRQAGRRLLGRRTGDFFGPPLRQVVPLQSITTRRPRAAVARRGEYFPVPPASVVVTAPSAIPQFIRPRARLPFIRRSQFNELPWSQITPPAPPPAIPATIRQSRRPALPPRRGRFVQPPWPAIAPPAAPAFVPRLLGGHRPQPGTPRRGRFLPTPFGQGQPPAFVCARRRGMGFRLRRGRLFDPPWPAILPQPTVWRPSPVVARRRPPAILARRGAFNEPVWPQVIPPEFIPGHGAATAGSTTGIATAGATSGSAYADQTGGHVISGGTNGTVQVLETGGEVTIG